MKRFRIVALALCSVAAFLVTIPAQSLAQSKSLPIVDGVVRTVDKAGNKLTIKHGPIPNLDMGGMTMVFRVQDPALLESLKAGDRIEFTADRIKGDFTVITATPVK